MPPENTVMLFCFFGQGSFSSLTRDQPEPPAVEAQSLNHWTIMEVPSHAFLNWKSRLAPFYFVFFIFQVIFLKHKSDLCYSCVKNLSIILRTKFKHFTMAS